METYHTQGTTTWFEILCTQRCWTEIYLCLQPNCCSCFSVAHWNILQLRPSTALTTMGVHHLSSHLEWRVESDWHPKNHDEQDWTPYPNHTPWANCEGSPLFYWKAQTVKACVWECVHACHVSTLGWYDCPRTKMLFHWGVYEQGWHLKRCAHAVLLQLLVPTLTEQRFRPFEFSLAGSTWNAWQLLRLSLSASPRPWALILPARMETKQYLAQWRRRSWCIHLAMLLQRSMILWSLRKIS